MKIACRRRVTLADALYVIACRRVTLGTDARRQAITYSASAVSRLAACRRKECSGKEWSGQVTTNVTRQRGASRATRWLLGARRQAITYSASAVSRPKECSGGPTNYIYSASVACRGQLSVVAWPVVAWRRATRWLLGAYLPSAVVAYLELGATDLDRVVE
ncbi:hypothetical protein BHE74_00000505 [Ensete ventricosum]|nr:hypothetical protein BHE74_00000505 [Ensete ventricosum]RZR76333.1 hypothetical protein BHM03_00001019 [Ensete ventricosum]